MRALTWLQRFRKSEKGNVFIIGAATLPLLIGSAGFAVDGIQVALWKRQLQRAADSAAIAGAYAMAQDSEEGVAVNNDLDEHVDQDLEENEKPVLSDVTVATGSYANGTLSSETCDARGTPCFGRSVEVRLTAQRTLPFMSIFTNSATTFKAEAVAALIADGDFCMISLYDGTDTGIDNNGNAEVNIGCGMAANSRSLEAIKTNGSAKTIAVPIMAVGGISGESDNYNGSSKIIPYAAPQTDPLAALPNPDVSGMDCDDSLSVQPNDAPSTKQPGCYSSIDIKGTVTLAAGTYYVSGGNIDFGAQANVTGTGVTLILTGPNGTAGNLNINGQAVLNLTAPTSGDYDGVVIVRDRRAATLDVVINGGGSSRLEGALYMPTSDISYAGNVSMNVECLRMIGRKLKFRGAARITNTCTGNGGANTFTRQIVRLIG